MSRTVIDSFEGEYEFLSNFYEGEPLVIDKRSYKSNEHWYQASKAVDDDTHDLIRLAATAGQAKKLGRQCKKIHPDWDDSGLRPPRKQRVMWKGLKIKFAPDSRLAKKLLATGDAELIEGNWWGDNYWGTVNGKGKNVLGRMLMRWRRMLRDNTARQKKRGRPIKYT